MFFSSRASIRVSSRRKYDFGLPRTATASASIDLAAFIASSRAFAASPQLSDFAAAALGNSFHNLIRGFEIMVRKSVFDPRDKTLRRSIALHLADAANMHQSLGMAGHAVEKTFVVVGFFGGGRPR